MSIKHWKKTGQGIRHTKFFTCSAEPDTSLLTVPFYLSLYSYFLLLDLWIRVAAERMERLLDGWMELCQAWVHHAVMMLAGFPLEHVPVGRKCETLSSLSTRPGQSRARPLPQEHKAGGLKGNLLSTVRSIYMLLHILLVHDQSCQLTEGLYYAKLKLINAI